jgi:geranylgeranyl pyrophosphate synthase
MSVSLMQLFSENRHDLIPLADILSMHFQIRDDYINLMQDSVRVYRERDPI